MAKYTIIYTDDGRIHKELVYRNEKFSYTMIPNNNGGAKSDKPIFDVQIEKKFPDTPEHVLEALENLAFADEFEVGKYLAIIADNEWSRWC